MTEKAYFACPNCGSVHDFIHSYTTNAWSMIDHIDADTGALEWEGTSDCDFDVIEDHGYECTACDYKFTKDEFDPAKKIAAAMADLARIEADDDDDVEPGEEPVKATVPTVEMDFLNELLKEE